MQVVIQHGDRRAGANLVIRGPGKKSTVIGPGCAQSFALEADQSLKLSVRTATAPAADEAEPHGEEST